MCHYSFFDFLWKIVKFRITDNQIVEYFSSGRFWSLPNFLCLKVNALKYSEDYAKMITEPKLEIVTH